MVSLSPPLFLAVIPCRLASTRLPKKVLKQIQGKSLLQRVWEQVAGCPRFDDIMIVCDDPQIQFHAHSFGAKATLSDPSIPSGTDRIADYVKNLQETFDYVINVQADEPLIQPKHLTLLCDELLHNQEADIVTLGSPLNLEDQDTPHSVKALTQKNGQTINFSRSMISKIEDYQCLYKHVGIYGYRREALLKFSILKPTHNEKTHRLEQLRAMDHGMKIFLKPINDILIGIDTQADLLKYEKYLNSQRETLES